MVNLNVQKYADRSYLFIRTSNVIRYSIIITNTGDSPATCVTLRDVISNGAHVICDSITIDACKVKNIYNSRGISVGTIAAGGNKIVTFEVEVDENCPPDSVTNKVIVSYCDENNNTVEIESNSLTIPIISIDVDLKKIVSSISAKVGDVLSYTVIIRNNSNIAINDVVLYDDLPSNVTLLPATVIVNGIVQYTDNLNGLGIGTINARSSAILIFQVKIESTENNSFIKNCSNVEYSYSVLELGNTIVSYGKACSNKVITKVSKRKCLC